jgi:hypothetical protein
MFSGERSGSGSGTQRKNYARFTRQNASGNPGLWKKMFNAGVLPGAITRKISLPAR